MVGLTSIAALLGLAALLMSFGELDPLLNPRYKVTVKSDDAAGLRPGGAVEYNGVPVGVVDQVYMESSDVEMPVRIVALVDSAVLLPKDVKPFATSPLIGGSSVLQLQPSHPTTQPLASSTQDHLPTDGSAMIVGPIRGGLFAQITEQLDQRMKPITDSLEKFNALSDTYVEVGHNLNGLFATQSPEQIAGGEQPNLRTAVVKLNKALDEATEGLQLARDFLADDQLRNDARDAVRKANALIDQASAAVTKYAELATSLQKDSNALVQRLLPVADSLGSTLEEVRRVTKLASEGQGTVGQLLNNPDLYNSLNDAAVRLEHAIIDLQLLIAKLREEGVNINF